MSTSYRSASGPLLINQMMYAAVKRVFDVILSVMILVVLSPLFLIIAAAIKIDSLGPAFFRQTRIGKGGKPFICYKFRSMTHNADQKVYEDFIKQAMKGESGSPRGKGQPFLLKQGRNDPRVTRVGRVLRQISFDELPQFFNVVKGDMSLVGPRPDVPASVEEYTAFEQRRLEVIPGITGLWQVSGRASLTLGEMFALDAQYVDQRSLWLDFIILLKTVPAVVRGHGAT